MGDLCQKKLIVELMGKHSNIIFCNQEGKIIDSIKHISSAVSSLREVLPGREYFIPETTQKLNPLTTTKDEFYSHVYGQNTECFKALYTSYVGLSPFMANEICFRAGGNCDLSIAALSEIDENEYIQSLEHILQVKMRSLKGKEPILAKASLLRFASSRGFEPNLIYRVLPKFVNCDDEY